MGMTLSEELQWRGFVNQSTFEDIKAIDGDPITFYWGVDPSADSMQVGNFVIAMMIKHFINHGHKPVLLVGGATGLIGDPDGKSDERELKSVEQVEHNKKAISAQYRRVFEGADLPIVDNYDWFKGMNYMSFLRDVGKHVPMSQMLGREFVQARLGADGSGISYAEFSYSLIQGYDFLHLFREMGVTMQVAGSDQWGNCVAGVELIRRIEGAEAHIWTAPLVMNKTTGKKFGKTEDGAVWLDEKKTSVFKFYQFWLNSGDDDVFDYLKIFTLLDKETIESLAEEMKTNAASRPAQKALAFEVTKLVHGVERAESVRKISEVLFGSGDYNELSKSDFEMLEGELPVFVVDKDKGLADFMVEAELASSKSEARRFLTDAAVYINGSQLPLDQTQFIDEDFISGYAVVRRGKNTTALAKLV
ncbi:tyrosine--tRNA ligase [Candidatus Saccharibacteria bacterium]|nr:tyrosine--tRNA ligase [Candidatus Saccharibacteria bacterium]